jgi:hypothetical protein
LADLETGASRDARLEEALAAYDRALTYFPPEKFPLDYVEAQVNRAEALSRMATLGSDRARLVELGLQSCADCTNVLNTYRSTDDVFHRGIVAAARAKLVMIQARDESGANHTQLLREALLDAQQAVSDLQDVGHAGFRDEVTALVRDIEDGLAEPAQISGGGGPGEDPSG